MLPGGDGMAMQIQSLKCGSELDSSCHFDVHIDHSDCPENKNKSKIIFIEKP